MNTEELPPEVVEKVDSLNKDELEFLEREVFCMLDEAIEDYHKRDIDTSDEIALYERALNTVKTVKKIRNKLEEEKIRQAKEFQGELSNL